MISAYAHSRLPIDIRAQYTRAQVVAVRRPFVEVYEATRRYPDGTRLIDLRSAAGPVHKLVHNMEEIR